MDCPRAREWIAGLIWPLLVAWVILILQSRFRLWPKAINLDSALTLEKEFFEKVDFEKKSAEDIKACKVTQ